MGSDDEGPGINFKRIASIPGRLDDRRGVGIYMFGGFRGLGLNLGGLGAWI